MAIKGIGIDVVEIERIREAVNRWGERFLNRIYTPAELQYSQKRVNPQLPLAARFAAKEAFAKAIGTGIGKSVQWKEIEIQLDHAGKPTIALSPRLRTQYGHLKIHLSMSHSRKYAIAAVTVEDDQG